MMSVRRFVLVLFIACGGGMVFGLPAVFAAPPVVLSENASGVRSFEAHLGGVVNPNNQLTECHLQYGRATVSENTVGCEPEVLKGFGEDSVGTTVGGLLAGTTYHYRLIARNGVGEEGAGSEQDFTTTFPPAARTEPASAIAANSATLNGVLNPEHSGESGSYEFVYRQSESECRYVLSPEEEQQLEGEHRITELEGDRAREAENKSTPLEAASGAQDETVAAGASELLPAARYTFCLLASNTVGETVVGFSQTLMTSSLAPAILSESAGEVTPSVTSLQATLNPENEPAAYTFEYATDPALQDAARTATGTLPRAYGSLDTTPVNIAGLAPDTTYYYRLTATNQGGASNGPIQSFTTPALKPPTLTDTSAIGAGQNTAQITATLQPEGLPTRWELQLGTSPGTLQSRLAANSTAGGADQVRLGVQLENLQPGTTYYYRLTAENPDGTAQTPILTFTTLPGAPAPEILTQTPGLPLLSIPPNVFPVHEPSQPTVRKLTSAQKLALALESCRKKHNHHKRASCEKQARKQYSARKKRR